jgi:hypothetical protein
MQRRFTLVLKRCNYLRKPNMSKLDQYKFELKKSEWSLTKIFFAVMARTNTDGTFKPFSADDIVYAARGEQIKHAPLANLFKKLKKLGLIRKTKTFVLSTRRGSRCLPLWEKCSKD